MMFSTDVMNPLNRIPQILVDAVPFDQLGSHSVVVPLSYVPENIYVMLPMVITYGLDISKVYEIDDRTGKKSEIQNMFVRDVFHPWLKINSSFFGTDPAKKTYQLHFAPSDSNSDETVEFDLYFSVIIQSDNPKKPYIYMKKDDEE